MTHFLPHLVGATSAGGYPMHGSLTNLHGQAEQYLDVSVAWERDDASPAKVAVYTDGQLLRTVDADTPVAHVPGTGEGDGSVTLLLMGQSDEPPAMNVDVLGRNALLRWNHVLVSDLVGYNLYHNADTEPMAELRGLALEQLVRAHPNSLGTSEGRISIWGTPENTDSIRTLFVRSAGAIIGSGAAQYRWSDQPTWTTFTFSPGGVFSPEEGIYVVFHDAAEKYMDGPPLPTWIVRIMPPRQYVTTDLEPGTHTFTVKAVDRAGNESAASDPFVVFVVDMPDALTDVVAEHDPDTGTLTVGWTLPANADGVRVYTNYDPHMDIFTDHIVTDGLPFAQIDGPLDEWVFTPAANGLLRYYLRPFNAECERDEWTVRKQSFPASIEDGNTVLGEPLQVAATPLAAGGWRLTWEYAVQEGDTISQFIVYRKNPDGAIDYDSDDFATVAYSAGVGYPVKRYAYDWTTDDSAGLPQRLAVRASNGTLTSLNTDYVVVTPDSTAPGAPTGLTGGVV